MSSLSQCDLQGRLEALIAEHDVPGAGAAILLDDDITEAAAGLTNLDTGVGVTTYTVFQIGSITKVYMATLVLQLVDDGKVTLDVPIMHYLPEVRFGDASVNAVLTCDISCATRAGSKGITSKTSAAAMTRWSDTWLR